MKKRLKAGKIVRLVDRENHFIDIDGGFVQLINDSELVLEFDFLWEYHADSCPDCGALSKAMKDRTGTWYVFHDSKFRLIDFHRFGSESYEDSGYHIESTRSSNHPESGYHDPSSPLDQTRIRFVLLPLEPGSMEAGKLISHHYGDKSRCDYLNRALNEN